MKKKKKIIVIISAQHIWINQFAEKYYLDTYTVGNDSGDSGEC